MIARLRPAGRLLVEVVFPRRCAGCGRRGSWVCSDCESTLPVLTPPWCVRCGTSPLGPGCRCHELPPSLDKARSASPYDGWVRRAVIMMKFEGERARAESLGPLLARLVDEMRPIDSLVPVPLHPHRKRERGFNQSEALAVCVTGEGNRIPVVTDLLVRTRPTRHQVGLGADERRANVHGAFAVRPARDLAGQRLVLVDDVLTTGATLGNCADALKAAGAAFVAAVTVARE